MQSDGQKTDFVEDLVDAGVAHHRAGELAAAERSYREALARSPKHAHALHMLGVIAHQTGRHGDAVRLIREAITIAPAVGNTHRNLSIVLLAVGHHDEALRAAQRAVQLLPADSGAWGDLGNALTASWKLEEALVAYRRAVDLCTTGAQTWSNLGGCLVDLGRLDEAIAAHRRAVAIAPGLAGAHWNLALALLSKGDWAGWREYEWRWAFEGFSSRRRHFSQPLWRGRQIDNQTLLLWAEQGHGDTIQFARFLPLVRQCAGRARLVLECQPRLVELLRQSLHRDITIIAEGDPLIPFDFHCPLMSLPLAVERQTRAVPGNVPYIHADARHLDSWASLLAPRDGRLRVGIAWAGSQTHRHDAWRSIPVEALAPLATLESVELHNLQLGADPARLAQSLPGLVDNTALQTDLAQTAALIAQLDLVITVDTSIAHLAGAMNKPTWLLLSYSPDWRWQRRREDSPWYPSFRLFRQSTPGNWAEPVERLRQALSILSAGASAPRA
jgi:Flp pilus assembly protein TadD